MTPFLWEDRWHLGSDGSLKPSKIGMDADHARGIFSSTEEMIQELTELGSSDRIKRQFRSVTERKQP